MLLERDLLDYLSVGSELGTLLLTAFGLIFVVWSLNSALRGQRIEAAPFVRVDIASVEQVQPDFAPPREHYRRSDTYLDLCDGDAPGIMLSAWFRNYQTHALGTAYAVTAAFLIQSGSLLAPVVNETSIAYLENEKPVVFDIVKVPEAGDATVTLLSLSYLDIYDNRHDHSYGQKGTNALYGRLVCTVAAGVVASVPEGRSRGRGVEYD